MIKINRTSDYEAMLEEITRGHEDILELVRARVKVFQKNPQDTRLDNHPLKRYLKGRWAFSVTDDIRIVYRWVGKSTTRFLAIGPHTVIYKKSS